MVAEEAVDYSKYFTIEVFPDMQSGLYYENLGPMRLIGAEYKLITYLSLDMYQEKYVYLKERVDMIVGVCQADNYEKLCKRYHEVITGWYNEVNDQREQLYVSLGKGEKEKYTEEEGAVRRKRGLIDVVGTGLHALFGLCDMECTKTTTDAIKRTEEGGTNMLHILKAQTTVMKTTVKKIQKDMQSIQHIYTEIKDKGTKLVERMQEVQNETEKIQNQLIITELHNIFTVLMDQFAFETTTLQQIVTAARAGFIHSSLMSPRDMTTALKEITQRVKTKLNLPMGTRASELYELHKITKMSAYYLEGKIVFITRIPLVTETELTLYHVIPVPVRPLKENVTPNDTKDRRLVVQLDGNKYIAITKDRKQYALFANEQIQDSCTETAMFKICAISQPLEEKTEEEPCIVQMFGKPERIPSECAPALVKLSRGIYQKLRHRNDWIFAVVNDTITTSCTDIPEPQITRISGSGFISIKDKNCQMFTKHAVLTTVDEIITKRYVDFVPKSNMSELFNKLPTSAHKLELRGWSTHPEMKLSNLNEVSHSLEEIEDMISREAERHNIIKHEETYSYWVYVTMVLSVTTLSIVIVIFVGGRIRDCCAADTFVHRRRPVREEENLQELPEVHFLRRMARTNLGRIYEELPVNERQTRTLPPSRPPSPV